MPELPFEIWKERVENEIKILKNLNFIESDTITWHENNVDFWVNIISLGFVRKDSSEKISLLPRTSHRIFIKLNRQFPYPGGIDLSWYSNIFHPNIHPIELQNSEKPGTGYICINILKKCYIKIIIVYIIQKIFKTIIFNNSYEEKNMFH